MNQSNLIRTRRWFAVFSFLVLATPALAGCEIAGDIFKAGVWVGVLLVIAVIGGVIWLFTRMGS